MLQNPLFFTKEIGVPGALSLWPPRNLKTACYIQPLPCVAAESLTLPGIWNSVSCLLSLILWSESRAGQDGARQELGAALSAALGSASVGQGDSVASSAPWKSPWEPGSVVAQLSLCWGLWVPALSHVLGVKDPEQKEWLQLHTLVCPKIKLNSPRNFNTVFIKLQSAHVSFLLWKLCWCNTGIEFGNWNKTWKFSFYIFSDVNWE